MTADRPPAALPARRDRAGLWLRRLVPLAVVALAMVLVFATGWHRHLSLETLLRHRAVVDEFIDMHTVAALAAFIGIYIVVVALSIPGAVLLTISGGILFGWLTGGLAAIIGATIGATVIFEIARTACGEALVRRAGPLGMKIADGFRANAFSYLLFLRLVPVFPFWLVNLAPALVGVRLGTFVAATAVGIIPGTFAFAMVGAGLDSAIVAQETMFRICIAAFRTDCRLNFDPAAAVTPQLIAALVALGLVSLIPVLVRRWKAAHAAPASVAGQPDGGASLSS
jgi:uncharacterized membrane protein YdjX (TVP38/TMEM64 family)